MTQRTTTATIGFSGLGKMGSKMSRNLLAAGFSLLANDLSDERLNELREAGAQITKDLRDLTACPVIILCLPGDREVREVLYGANGIAPLLKPDQLVVDMSTTSVVFSREVHAAMADKKIRFLDAPVSGGPPGAEAGTLTIMAGGDAETFERAKPYFAAMGKTILHMGGPGCGQLSKAINNVFYNVSIALIAEMMPIAVSQGLDPERIAQVINASTGRSYATEWFFPRIFRREFTGAYQMGSAYKDMVNLTEIALHEAIPTPVLDGANLTYRTALRKGFGDMDKSAMILLFENLLGVKVET